MKFTPARATRPCRPVLLAALPVLLLAGCADVKLPAIVLDDGPAPAAAGTVGNKDPQQALTGQRPIRRADSTGTEFPSLATVPDRPTQFSSPVQRQSMLDRLQADQTAAEAASGTLGAAPVDGTQPVTSGPLQVPAAPPTAPQPLPR